MVSSQITNEAQLPIDAKATNSATTFESFQFDYVKRLLAKKKPNYEMNGKYTQKDDHLTFYDIRSTSNDEKCIVGKCTAGQAILYKERAGVFVKCCACESKLILFSPDIIAATFTPTVGRATFDITQP